MKGSWLVAPALVSVLGTAGLWGLQAGSKGAPRQVPNGVLAGENVHAALRAWDDAYGGWLTGQRSEDLVELGDAYRRLGDDPRARATYLAALASARKREGLDDVLRVVEAFAELGDRELTERSLRIAELLAAGDAEAQADVRVFAARFPAELLERGE